MRNEFPIKLHDGPVQGGFPGYLRVEIDPNGESPDGNITDTYVREDQMRASAEELHVLYTYERGEITREEAETLLDMVAASQDL